MHELNERDVTVANNMNNGTIRRNFTRQISASRNNFRGMKKDAIQQQTNMFLASMTVR